VQSLMTERILVAGFGGQGIMLLGKVIALSAMKEGKEVLWFPSYGAEVRGGTAHCLITISDKPIPSPLFQRADTAFIFNEPSLIKFKKRISPRGLLILNGTLIKQPVVEKCKRIVNLPLTAIATEMGNVKVANMIALGAYLAVRKTVTFDSVLSVFKEIAPKGRKDLIRINEEALKKGKVICPDKDK